ncbi:CRISPR-associated protein Csn2-St [Aerococcus urinaeequi]
MSRRIQIQTKSLNLDFTIDAILAFVGGNVASKREILNVLLQTATRYIEEHQEKLIINSGKIWFDGMEINNRNIDIIYLDQYHSLYKEIILKKTYLLYDEVIELSNQIQIVNQVEQINDEISKFEFQMNQSLNSVYPELSLNFPYISQDILMKKFATLELNLELVTSKKMIDTFLKLVSHHISQTGNRMWIILDGIDRHFDVEELTFLYESLEKIANDTHRLNIFLFNMDHTIERLNILPENCILVYNDIQQLSPINEMYLSIERHYPDNNLLAEELLQKRILKILPYIGYSGELSLSGKDMVLLMILKKLLGDDSKIETSIESLSNLENLYLENQV